MADKISKKARSKIMAAIKSKDTAVELALRKDLFSLGSRFKIHYKRLCGRPDIVFPEKKIAIFVDGCFWHGCPKHYRAPKTRKFYWLPKIKRNKERDKEANKKLKKEGYSVIRIWEHEIRDRSYRKKLLDKIKK